MGGLNLLILQVSFRGPPLFQPLFGCRSGTQPLPLRCGARLRASSDWSFVLTVSAELDHRLKAAWAAFKLHK
jgi:hypothetical protein